MVGNNCGNYFTINFHKSYVAKLGFETVKPRSAVRSAAEAWPE